MVTEWVKWQQRFAPSLGEAPPMPSERSIAPEELPKFDKNLDYETHSEKSPSTEAKLPNEKVQNDPKLAPEESCSPVRGSGTRRSRQDRNAETRSSIELGSKFQTISDRGTFSEKNFHSQPPMTSSTAKANPPVSHESSTRKKPKFTPITTS